MVLIKHNSLKSDIFFNPIFMPGFSGSGSRVQVQVLEVAINEILYNCLQKQPLVDVLQIRKTPVLESLLNTVGVSF